LKNPEERIARTITVFMKVQACYPEFTLDKTMLNFWDCKVHERKKITIKITNKHTDLPLDFSFNKISFFSAEPISGMVSPVDISSSKNPNQTDIDIFFHPESFGNYSDVIIFRYINNMYTFPIRVLGSCKQIGKVPEVSLKQNKNRKYHITKLIIHTFILTFIIIEKKRTRSS